jgi:signal-transduction protein with cAMP-binding, CBS, and nucleotidyltransferase domain
MKPKLNKEKKISKLLLGYRLSPNSIKKLLEIAKVVFVKNKTNLVHIGDINQNVYFIVEGGFVARSFYFDSQNLAATNFFISDYFPFMGCLDSFFTGAQTKTELIAVKNSLVLAFHKPEFEKLMVENKDILLLYVQMLSEFLKNEAELKTVLIGSSKKDIYEYLIEKCNPVIKSVSGKYIAEFIGITPEWYSKMKRG